MPKQFIDIPKNTWTKVLTNATILGQVFIQDMSPLPNPTEYKVTLVNTGDPAPVFPAYDGGVNIECCFMPSETLASDYYVLARNHNGKVEVYT